LVAVDREACALYKVALDKYLPPEYSQVIYSTAPHDIGLLRNFSLSPQEEQRIINNFGRKEELPKILIFTEKLLTGVDAPILYCLYLDKPLRDHSLLQAISRINRPYGDGNGLVKTSGLVVDFIGIYQELEKVLADETQAKVEELAREKDKAEAERQALGIDENTFAIYTTLKPVIRTLIVEQAKEINSFFTHFPEFVWNQQQNRQLRIQLYKTLQPFVEPQKMIELTNELLKLQRI
jgi:type I site-specific restriction-modification system R (restriction) subunit